MKILHITSVEEVYITYTAEVDFNNDLLDWVKTQDDNIKNWLEDDPSRSKEIALEEFADEIADLLVYADKETQKRFGFIWWKQREFCESTEREIELTDEKSF